MSQLFKNNAKSRLASAVSPTDLTFTVTTGEGVLFPTVTAGDHLLVTLENSAGDKEIVRVSLHPELSDVFTFHPTPGYGRGQEGTAVIGFDAQSLVELRLTAGFIDALKEGSIVYVIDGGGSAISTGQKGWIEAPFNGTIKSCRLFADQTGAINVNIWKDTYDNYPPVISDDDVTPVAGLSISGAIKAQFTDLSDWTNIQFNQGDIFAFNVASCTAIQRLTISLTVDRY